MTNYALTQRKLWERYQKYLCVCEPVGLSVDVSRMHFSDDFFEKMRPPLERAFAHMANLEKGAIANPDEKRMVGHYWLRAPELAPDKALTDAILRAQQAVEALARRVHSGELKPERAAKFKNVLIIGIGGSALGPQFVADALTSPADQMTPFFFDNTDPDGIDRTLHQIGGALPSTLTVVISKSGGTKETRNGMLEAKRAYEKLGLDFGKHAVAVTGEGSELDEVATESGFLARLPMWDWVGGRTSELSAVGLLPAALQGLDWRGMLEGARRMDELTRVHDAQKNPAALLALMWHHAGDGKGLKDMVVLPYKDRLLLLSRYLQQLVMESLGKEKDLNGNVVHQGLAVYGNKGSTDQHAYVQQLREGIHNFFATFIEVQKDRAGESLKVEEDVTSGDYLFGFFLGTRRALFEKDRESITLTAEAVNAQTVGALIALFERAVGLYAFLVNINAYHQPGVEAGKKAATAVIELQRKLLAALRANSEPRTAEQLASELKADDEIETVHKLLQHLAANPQDHGVKRRPGKTVFSDAFHL